MPRLDDAVQENTEASGLGSYLSDAHNLLEADGCWRSSRIPLQFVSDDGKPALLKVGEYELDPYQHALSPSDPLVHALLSALAGWFTMPADANVALTGALSALVRCPHRSLAGWLLYDTRDDHDLWLPPDDSASDTSFDEAPSRAPSRADMDDVHAHHTPALYQVLRELVRHVGRFRAAVPGFDRLLSERRQGLLFADHLEEAMNAMLEDVVVAPVPAPSPGFLGLPSPFGGTPGGERKKSVSLASSLRSFWSPRKSRPTTPTQSTPATAPSSPVPAASPSPALTTPSTPRRPSALPPQSPTPNPRAVTPQPAADTPFSSHYAAAAVSVDVEPVYPVQGGPWRPNHRAALSDPFRDDGDETEEAAIGEEPPLPQANATTLSSILDNMIVLEELIKELVALIVARRAMGIDQVGFVARR